MKKIDKNDKSGKAGFDQKFSCETECEDSKVRHNKEPEIHKNIPESLTIKELAKLLSVSVSSINNWSRPKSKYFRPEFPRKRTIGENTVRFMLAEVMLFIDASKTN
jgi:predicted DNA-binding transcriptional regulator AlpA